MKQKILSTHITETPLGPMVIVADNHWLYLLEFCERRTLEKQVQRLKNQLKAVIQPGKTAIIDQIEQELSDYFKGNLRAFKTAFFLAGTDFQKKVWQQLVLIPPGETRSYLDIARSIGNEKGYRAVANANGANRLALIVPCHRVINESGKLGGYAAGLNRKQWLLEHEKKATNP